MAPPYIPPLGSSLGLDFDSRDTYAPPAGDDLALGFLTYPPYKPPFGHKAAITFLGDGDYVPPAGNQAAIEFTQGGAAPDLPAQYMFAQGADSAELGELYARLGFRPVMPEGFDSVGYGKGSTYNSDQHLRPSGIYRATLFGALDIRNLNRSVRPGTLGNVARYGALSIRNRNQHVDPFGVIPPAPGRPQIRNTRQIIRLATGIAPRDGYGDGRIWNNNPEAYPFGFNAAAYGTPSVWNSLQFVSAKGIPRTLVFGLADIRNLNRYLPVDGIPRTTGYGRPGIRNKNRELTPPSLGNLGAIGTAKIWNRTQNAWTAPAARGAAYGRPAIINLNRYYEFGSLGDSAAYGNPRIWNRNYWLTLGNIEPPLPGAPHVWNRNQFVRTSAVLPKLVLGKPEIINRNQFLRAAGSHMAQFGITELTHQHRTIIVRPLPYPPVLSTEHELSQWPHYVKPQLLNSLQMGWQHQVYSDRQEVGPQGFDTLEWGKRIIPVHREIEIAGWHSMEFANPQNVYSTTRSIRPAGFATHEQPWLRWGTNTVWNWQQHVALYYDVEADTNGEKWPLWTKIENRNRVMRTYGTDGAKVSRPEILLKSRLLFPGSIEAPANSEFYKAGSVTHWLQRVLPEGLFGRMGDWLVVYYGQGHIRPVPMADFAAVPEPAITNTRRYYRWVGRIDGSAWGRPFVAYGVRTIKCEARFGLEPPLMRLPRIENSDQYVDPVSFDAHGFGLTNLHIYWATLRPRWKDEPEFGAAKVQNVTPEVTTAGRAFDRLGRPAVRLEWRRVSQQWSDSFAVIGKQLVGYRTRHIEPSTADYLRFGIIADIEGGRREIPFKRTVQPFGVGAPAFPSPRTNVWTIRVTGSAADGHRFGLGVQIWANSLYPRSIQWQRFIGNPFVRRGYVPAPDPGTGEGPYQPPSEDPGEDDDTYVPPPTVEDRRISAAGGIGIVNMATEARRMARVSPYTIYAPSSDEATPQAVFNHPTFDSPKPIIGMALGVPRIHHWLRYVDMRGAEFAPVFGTARFDLLRRYVRPSGWHHGRHGWQWVKGGVQFVEQYDSFGPSMLDGNWMGNAGVRDPHEPPPPQPKPAGFSSMRFGNDDNINPNRNDPRARLRVELKNRKLPVTGWDSMIIGKDSYRSGPTDYYTDPYRYPHRLTVYFPRPAPMKGFDRAEYGTPWVSFRVRDLGVRGFDSLLADYDNDFFKERMRVIRVLERELPEEQAVGAHGFDSFLPSVTDVRPMTHYIRPDGNSDQHRKGAF